MKVGDLVKVKTVEEQPLGIITKVARYDIQRNGGKKYYVLVSGYDHAGPVPFLGPQLEVLSKSA